jgi:tRNA-modifying protein YgfZ
MQNPTMPASLLTLEGPDAAAFAQAQFSSDVSALAPGQWHWSAWLDARGRCRAFMQMARPAPERFVALLRGGDAMAMAHDLKRFVFRAKVDIGAMGNMSVIDGPALQDGLIVADEPRDLILGGGARSWRVVDGQSAHAGAHATHSWIDEDIEAGLPWLPDAALGELLPQSLSFERLGAVSFNKGCFPGQEIVARMHYRGAGKQHLHTASFDSAALPGATLRRDGAAVGIVLTAHTSGGATNALVALNDTAVADERIVMLDVEGVPMKLASLHAWPH